MSGYARAIAKFERTTFTPGRGANEPPQRRVALTIAHHPDPRRVGDRALLEGEGSRASLEVDRLRPAFFRRRGEEGAPLDDPFLSRKAVRFVEQKDGGVLVDNPAALDVEVDGRKVTAVERVSAERIARGAAVVLGGRVVLVLHRVDPALAFGPDLGMVGQSEALEEVRRRLLALAQQASSPGAVLVRAETGSGKELAARALHEHGPRRGRPFVAVNLAAIPPSTAPAELFGHEKGAFTGAEAARPGYVGAAEHGTLFLDEIGEASLEVQGALLRALDQRQVQPLGGRVRSVDVFVVAATDADLERLVAEGRFRGALLHRLQAAEVRIPPLRARREDIGRLFFTFLEQALLEEGRRLEDQSLEETPWPSAALMAAVVQHPWPGNVWELQNFARRAALERRLGRALDAGDLPKAEAQQAGLSAAPERAGPPPCGGEDEGETSAGEGRPARALDDDAVLAALRAHRFQLNKTAKALGITRVKLDQLIEKHPGLRKAKDLTREEILAARQAAGGDLDEAAARLMVSPRGLRLRMTQLGVLDA